MVFQKSNLPYWSAQLFGWGLYTVLLIVSSFIFQNQADHFDKIIALQVIVGTSCFLVSHVFRNHIKKNRWSDMVLRQIILRSLIGSVIAAVTSQVIIHFVIIVFLDWHNTVREIQLKELPIYTFNVYVMYLGWCVFYFGYHFFQNARQSKVEKLMAEGALREAELIALKAQINPHFLFNALNNIRALILEDQMKARDMVTNLSEMLRYSIQFNRAEKVTIEEEIRIVKDYLDLEMIHYDNRLKYVVDIDELSKTREIPPMAIQLLVENAIKHGISKLPEGGEILVKTYVEKDELIIEVKNTGVLEASDQKGIGITNALDRIKILFDSEPNFSLKQVGESVLATITIPHHP